jgi:hypothetical protein
MPAPGDEAAAGAAGRLRVSHADRDQVIDGLKAAFVAGRLDHDEFGQRVGRALVSRTYADLAALTADLPAWRPVAQPPAARPAGPAARERVNRTTVAAASWATLAGAVLLACWGLLPETSGPVETLILLASFIVLAAGPLGWLLVFHDWLEKARRSPGTGGPAFRSCDQADPARQVQRADRDPGLTAEAAPSAPGPLRPRIAVAHPLLVIRMTA